MAHSYQIQVLEHHLDTFGHVNHATYATMFEEARWAMITERGFGLKEVQLLQQGPIILEMQLRFKSELLLRERVEIQSQSINPSRRIHHIHQQMIKPNGETACEAEFKIGFFDMKTRQLVKPPEIWFEAINS